MSTPPIQKRLPLWPFLLGGFALLFVVVMTIVIWLQLSEAPPIQHKKHLANEAKQLDDSRDSEKERPTDPPPTVSPDDFAFSRTRYPRRVRITSKRAANWGRTNQDAEAPSHFVSFPAHCNGHNIKLVFEFAASKSESIDKLFEDALLFQTIDIQLTIEATSDRLFGPDGDIYFRDSDLVNTIQN